MVGEMLSAHFWNLPARHVNVQPVNKRHVVANDVGAQLRDDAMQAELFLGEKLDDRRMEAGRDDGRGADDNARLRLRQARLYAFQVQ